MPRLRPALSLAAAALLLPLAACSGPPWVLSRSPDSVALRWYTELSDEAQAHAVAGGYCIPTGRAARLVDLEQDGSAVIARYHCG